MSKRKIKEDDEYKSNEVAAKYARTEDIGKEFIDREHIGDHQSKHTLDSDEEDEVKYTKLDMNKVEGQEGSGDEYEGKIKLTPFNMKEDLEDGHFDSEGSFIFNKKEREIQDAWLDNIDWSKVKETAGTQWHQMNDEDSSTVKSMGDEELKSVYKELASYLSPNETVERAIKRLGKQKGLSAAEDRKRRWAAKNAGVEYVDEASNLVKKLTGLADSLVSKGEFEAYQYSLEKINHSLKEMENRAIDKLDMFSDVSPAEESSKTKEAIEDLASDSTVYWEYKLSNTNDAEIFGPVSSEEMLRLQTDNRFVSGGWARKLVFQMKLSPRQQQFVSKSAYYAKFLIRWGFVPLVVALGIYNAPDKLPDGSPAPHVDLLSIFLG